jgi:hypothetical protein
MGGMGGEGEETCPQDQAQRLPEKGSWVSRSCVCGGTKRRSRASRLRFADSQAPRLRSIQTFKTVSEGVYSEVQMQQDPA